MVTKKKKKILPRTLGCWNLVPVLYELEKDRQDNNHENEDEDDEADMERRHRTEQQLEYVWKPFAKMFGWKENNMDTFDVLMGQMIGNYPGVAKNEGIQKQQQKQQHKNFNVPDQYQPYLRSMYKAHDAIIRQCYSEMAETADYYNMNVIQK